jgi:uncharacterized protein (TIGR02444 family)
MAEPSSKPAATGSPFWRFSLGFYRRSGVADACITLQERSGVDVNLLLYLLWQASQGRAFAAEEVAALEEVIGPWRAATVIPLRTVRRALKEPPGLVASPAAEVFRNKIKAVELEAERLQQEAMYELAQAQSEGRSVVSQVASSQVAARHNVAAYETMLGAPLPAPAVEALLENFAAMNTGG